MDCYKIKSPLPLPSFLSIFFAVGIALFLTSCSLELIGQASITVPAIVAPSNLQYSPATLIATYDNDLALSPSFDGDEPTSYSIAPALPAGLTLDTQSGVITGTGTTNTDPTTYTITASNSAGSTDVTVEIRSINGFYVDAVGDDVDDNPGDGRCEAAGGACTLRAAVEEANTLTGMTIVVPENTTVIMARTVPMIFTANMTIKGDDEATSVVDGGGVTRIFQNTTVGVTVSISDLTLQSGLPSTLNGGGGAILYNDGTLNLSYVSFNSNAANGTGNGGAILAATGAPEINIDHCTFNSNSGSAGGAIYFANNAQGEISDSYFKSNFATGVGGAIRVGPNSVDIKRSLFVTNQSGPTSIGGAIAVTTAGGTVNIENSTFTQNIAGTAVIAISAVASTVNILNSTIAENTNLDQVEGGAISGGIGSNITFTNSIFASNLMAGNPQDNCRSSGIVSSFGNNLYDTAGGDCPAGAGDQFNSDPGLDALADNGGFTYTMGIPSGSSAENAGTNVGCPAVDQRGVARPQGGTCDIGAFELE